MFIKEWQKLLSAEEQKWEKCVGGDNYQASIKMSKILLKDVKSTTHFYMIFSSRQGQSEVMHPSLFDAKLQKTVLYFKKQIQHITFSVSEN